MASITLTVPAAVAAAMVTKYGRTFDGRSMDATETTVSVTGSKSTCSLFADTVNAMIRAQVGNAGEAATARQISYLQTLVQADPGYATTVGVPANLATLSKARASALIDRMVENTR